MRAASSRKRSMTVLSYSPFRKGVLGITSYYGRRIRPQNPDARREGESARRLPVRDDRPLQDLRDRAQSNRLADRRFHRIAESDVAVLGKREAHGTAAGGIVRGNLLVEQ